MILVPLFYIFSATFWIQKEPPLKPTSQFDVVTNYLLRKKPISSNQVIVFETNEHKKESESDLLPFLSIQLKVKYSDPYVEQIKVVDGSSRTVFKKKVTDSGVYDFDLGYIDDIKDGIISGNFVINFLDRKKVIEIITLTIEKDGSFFVNGEKRGKF